MAVDQLQPSKSVAALYHQPIRLLACEFEVQSNSHEVMDLLSFVTQRAEQDVPVTHRSTITISSSDGEFAISGADIDESELGVTSTVEILYETLYRQAFAAMPDHIAVRAITGMHAGHTFLIVGGKRAGKSTLAVRLALEGFNIGGDHVALVRNGSAIAFPQRFRLPPASLALMPKHPALVKYMTSTPQEGQLIPIDPLDLGKPWRIAPAEVSCILYIEPNHGAETRIRVCGKVDMMRRVLPHCTMPVSRRADWISDLSTSINHAHTHVIDFGDLDSAVASIKDIFE